MSREAVYLALIAQFQPLQAAGTIKTLDRRLRGLNEMSAAELPAIFVVGAKEKTDGLPGVWPGKRAWGIDVYIYVAAPDQNSTADTPLNALIEAIETILDPKTDYLQTLGGEVAHLIINGTTERYTAPKGARAAALMPLQITPP